MPTESNESIERLPFREAQEAFRKRGKFKLPTESWAELYGRQHDLAFVVAGAREDGILEDLYNAIRDAEASGWGMQQFLDEFPNIAASNGWAYKGSPGWRARVIYETNITQARRAGELEQNMLVRETMPYWTYKHSDLSLNPRLDHQAWDGLTLRWDDPWWQTHHPMNGWGCKCRVIPQSKGDLERAGKKPDVAPEVKFETRKIGTQKGSLIREVKTPMGVDPGFGHPPSAGRELLPHVPEPLDGWDLGAKVGSSDPLPIPEPRPASVIKDASKPLERLRDLFNALGITQQLGGVVKDPLGTPLAVGVSMFQNRSDPNNPVWKWEDKNKKQARMEFPDLLADTIINPQEVWWRWERELDRNRKPNGKWRLKRRHLKLYSIEGYEKPVLSTFEFGKLGWTGISNFVAKSTTYFRGQRMGKRLK